MSSLGRFPLAAYVFFSAALAAAQPAEIDIALGWRFAPDPERRGEAAGWAAPQFDDSGWATIDAGARWEDQGFRDLDGDAWYRKHVRVPKEWQGKPVFFVLGGINDAGTVFCNGAEVNSYGDGGTQTMYQTPIIAELSAHLKFGEMGLLAVRVRDWGGNGGLWKAPCTLTTQVSSLPLASLILLRADLSENRVVMDVDRAGLGSRMAEAPIQVRAGAPAGKAAPEPQTITGGTAAFELKNPGAGEKWNFVLELPFGADSAVTYETSFEWPAPPAWTGEFASLNVRNNFVTDLLIVDGVESDPAKLEFKNPREGWVLFSILSDDISSAAPAGRLAGAAADLVWRVHPESGARESMQYLAAGARHLKLAGAQDAELAIRAIPELGFCYYPSAPHVKNFGNYEGDYLARHVLSDVNLMVARSEIPPERFKSWIAEGRRWLASGSVLGLKAPEPPKPADVAAAWLANEAVKREGMSGLIVDEFTMETEAHYAAWTEAIGLLDRAPEFADRKLYAWCVDLFRDPGPTAFSRRLIDLGHYLSWEMYLHEEPTEEAAERAIHQKITQALAEWRRAVPGVERSLLMAPGYFSAPPETLDVEPGADYRVFLDMQMHAMANDPAYFSMRGVMGYLSDYADEEYLRTLHRLFRHYCIEGQRERMTDDPYLLPHLANPDFKEGLNGWTIESAEPGSVVAGRMDGFSYLEGRYPRYSAGDQFCEMRASAKGPNRASQEIRALEPGRAYSLKMYSANLGKLDLNAPSGLKFEIQGAEMDAAKTFEHVFPSSYSHDVPPYNASNPAHMTFHHIIFKPAGRTAKLTLADSPSAEGQKTAFNFVQVQPYSVAEN